ncbi:hypothetical protein Goshw_018259 [Gossypium schwendimanii]|uniref:Uncharacterized protein n=1 Tax=Gossypium schwendimanii TaxID=34291 RepID=A0A7J9KYS8_GOSSC|nr:hypothetical protein [Gossypium schwendimanii]
MLVFPILKDVLEAFFVTC